MKKAALGVLFFLGFFSKAQAWVDEPSGCWKQESRPCALRFSGHESLQSLSFRLSGATGSSLLILKDHSIQVVAGPVFIEALAESVIFEQFSLRFKMTGQVLVQKDPSLVTLRQFQGATYVQGSLEGDGLIAGFENWWSLGAQGVLKPFDRRKSLADWNRLVRPEAVVARQAIRSYNEAWQASVEQSSQIYQEVLSRRIASADSAEEERHRKSLEKKKNEEKLRQMLKQRYFDPYH